MNSGQHFTVVTQHLTPAVVIIKIPEKVGPSRATKAKKRNENCRLGFIESEEKSEMN